jgi:hypothetical protein
MISRAHAHKNVKQTPVFAQSNPRYTCRYATRFKELSERKGFGIKCRSINCSLECNSNWAFKHSTCLTRHLLDLPENLAVYKGHLTLPKDSTPDQHKIAKDTFLLSLRRWAKRHSCQVELHAVIHVTDPKNAHWDYHMWTNAQYRPLHNFFLESWQRCGGKRPTMVEPDSIQATARYQNKPVEIDEKAKEFWLPSTQPVMGIDTQWSTRGFWLGKTTNEHWREWIEEWKSGPVVLNKDCYQEILACEDCRNLRPKLCKIHNGLDQNKRDITDTPDSCKTPYQDDRYIPGLDSVRDQKHFVQNLPQSPSEGVGLSTYADRWGVSTDYMLRILQSSPHAVQTSGELVGNKHSWHAWYRTTKSKMDVIQKIKDVTI